MYSLKDVSVIIATCNRAQDLIETLESFRKARRDLAEVIIVDQSDGDEAEKAIASFREKKIRYMHSSVRSLTHARNLGVKHVSKQTSLVLFIDDDVTLSEDYFDNILNAFNENPGALGVGGYYVSPGANVSKFENVLRRIFCIEHRAPNDARVMSAYGAVYPSRIDETIKAQWLVGFNMAYKRDVFKRHLFDEKLERYALGEDFDFSYRVFLDSPGSLYLTPHATLVHRTSPVERTPSEKNSYMNQIHHFYFNYKNFNKTFYQKLTFAWTVLGITILRTIQFASRPSAREGLKLKYYFASLWYCLNHLREIKRGTFVLPQ